MCPQSTKFLLSSCRRVRFGGMTGNLPGLLGGTQLWHLPSLLTELPEPAGRSGARLLRDAQGGRVQPRRFSGAVIPGLRARESRGARCSTPMGCCRLGHLAADVKSSVMCLPLMAGEDVG